MNFDRESYDDGFRAGLAFVSDLLEYGEVDTFTVAAWVTKSVNDEFLPDEKRLTSVRALRVDVLQAALDRGKVIFG